MSNLFRIFVAKFIESMEATLRTPMRSVTISFNPRNKKAAQFIETVKLMDFFKVEESPYDPAFVARINAMDESKAVSVDIDDLWK